MRSGARTPAGGSSEPKVVEAAAVRLLARREHSIDELTRKLAARGYDRDIVAAVVEKLSTKRLVSDERFAAGAVHHRARRGLGPVRIRAELRQQGIADSMIDHEFRAADVDWARLAAQVRQRKFGEAPPGGLSERAKQARFLQYRGFSADQIRAAFSGSDELPEIGDEPTGDWPD